MEKPKIKKKLLIILLASAGILLLLIGSFDLSNQPQEANSYFLYDEYEKALEEKIEAFCRSIEGIENVKVLITLDTSTEKVYAQNSSISSSQTTYEYLLFGSDSALPLYEVTPKIRGIAIACDGGSNASVQKILTDLISCATGVASNKIKVVGYG